MCRIFLVTLLALDLVACPLQCIRCEGESHVHADSPSACTCCADRCQSIDGQSIDGQTIDGHDEAGETGSTPETPYDDCGCHGCICEGAILNIRSALPDCDTQCPPIFLDPAVDDARWLVAVRGGTDTLPRRSHILPSDGGRPALIAHQVWRL